MVSAAGLRYPRRLGQAIECLPCRNYIAPKVEADTLQSLNALYNMRQGIKGIMEGVNEASTLYLKCPDNFGDLFANLFVAKLADESKLDMLQLYLSADPQ